MWFSYQYWGCTQLEKSCWWIRGESVVFSRSQQKEGKWSPLFLLLKARWTRWFPWTSDLLINKSKQCRWKQTLCCPTLAKTINWERNNHRIRRGGRILFGRLRRHRAMIIWLMVSAWSVVSVSDIQNYALTEGTTKYSKYYLGQVYAEEEYVIVQTCTEWLCARRKTDFCKNTSWTTGDGQQPQHASFRTTSGCGN